MKYKKWNYRIVDFTKNKEVYREVCEVYYNEADKPVAFCVATLGWHPEQGQTGSHMLEMIKQAFNKDVIPHTDLVDFADIPRDDD